MLVGGLSLTSMGARQKPMLTLRRLLTMDEARRIASYIAGPTLGSVWVVEGSS